MPVSGATERSFKDRLVRMYAIYNPACLASVDAILRNYEGRESELLRVLVSKYGPEPDDGVETHAENHASEPQSAPIQRVPSHSSRQRVQDLIAAASEAMTSDPKITHSDPAPHRGQLAPQRSTTPLEDIATAASPTPHTTPNISLSVKDVGGSSAAIAAVKARLVAFYSMHNREMLPFVGDVLSSAGLSAPESVSVAEVRSLGDSLMRELVANSGKDKTERAAAASRASASSFRSPSATAERPMSDLLTDPSDARRSRRENKISDATVADVERDAVIEQLSDALDKKTTELQRLQERIASELRHKSDAATVKIAESEEVKRVMDLLSQHEQDASQRIAQIEKKLAAALASASAVSAEKEELCDQLARASSEVKKMSEESAAHRCEVQRLKSSLALREHQNRMLRMRFEHLQEENRNKDDRIAAVAAEKRDLDARLRSSIHDLGAVVLHALPEANDASVARAQFQAVTAEIERRFEQHYEKRLAMMEAESQEYYLYAKKQIANRDEIITEFSEKAVEEASTAVETAAQQMVNIFPENERRLASEVARLQVKLAMQREQHRVALQSVAEASRQRQEGDVRPPVWTPAAVPAMPTPPPPPAQRRDRDAIPVSPWEVAVKHAEGDMISSKIARFQEARGAGDERERTSSSPQPDHPQHHLRSASAEGGYAATTHSMFARIHSQRSQR